MSTLFSCPCVCARKLLDQLNSIETRTFWFLVACRRGGSEERPHDGNISVPVTKGRRSRCSIFQTYLDKIYFAVLSNPQMCLRVGEERNPLGVVAARKCNIRLGPMAQASVLASHDLGFAFERALALSPTGQNSHRVGYRF